MKWGAPWLEKTRPSPLPPVPKAQLLGSVRFARRAEYTVRTNTAHTLSVLPLHANHQTPPCWEGKILLGNTTSKHAVGFSSMEERNDAVPRSQTSLLLFTSGIQPQHHRTSPKGKRLRKHGDAVKIVCVPHWAAASNSERDKHPSTYLLQVSAVAARSRRWCPLPNSP